MKQCTSSEAVEINIERLIFFFTFDEEAATKRNPILPFLSVLFSFSPLDVNTIHDFYLGGTVHMYLPLSLEL